ncbi:MAG: hypothetical protein COA96_10920 [SAR86 cluster bacterium]|uniref:TraB/GumN family protein n=1 Tax=SAR86 cluster bacterium TaxID=2030880 RepID=A0A2A5AXL3_9GAMM|nr:MAG: hypothetical protein COA96_10920 [SAR86 cluster bacterium]
MYSILKHRWSNPARTDSVRSCKLILPCLLLISVFLQYNSIAAAQPDQVESRFIRFTPGTDDWQGELQTAVVTYRNAQGIEVDLVAAVHIAETEYYQQLNEYFQSRDRVLYELVAEADHVPDATTQAGNSSILGFVQQALANFLNVSFQLNQIDYMASNFQHADLTPSQLREIMLSKNENFFTMFLNLALAQMAEMESSGTNNSSMSAFNALAIIRALGSENQNDAFKYLLAEELGRSGGVIVGPAMEAQLTILGDRNRVVLEKLEEALLDDQIESISVFFGAAHMPGIERVLTTTLGFERTGQLWRAAWVIP